MSPEERQLLTDLFDRVRSAAGSPRDAEAERLIADAVRAEPASPYLLAQAVIVQEKGLEAAAKRITELEGKLRDLEANQRRDPDQDEQRGGFLSSIFGSAQPPRQQPRPPQAPAQQQPNYGNQNSGPWGAAPQSPQQGYASQGPQQGYAPQAPQQGYAQQPTGPWTQQPVRSPSTGGSFLTGALGAAAGVAGGMLLANSLSGVFGNHMASLGLGTPQAEGFGTAPVEETVINNYYGDSKDAPQPDAAANVADQPAEQNVADDQDQNFDASDSDVQNADYQDAGNDSWNDDGGDLGGGDDSSYA